MKISNLDIPIKDENGKSLGGFKQFAVVNEKREIVKDDNGSPLIASWTEPKEVITLRKVLIRCILTGEEKKSKEQKHDDYMLFLRLAEAKSIEFTNAEIERLKTVCGLLEPTIIYGQVAELLKDKK